MQISFRLWVGWTGAAAIALSLAIVVEPSKDVYAQSCSLGAPPPELQHIVWIVMENRRFDHLAGWLTGTQSQTYHIGDPGGPACGTYDLNGTQPPTCGVFGFGLPSYVGTGDAGDPAHAIAELTTGWHGGDNSGWLFVDPYTQSDMNPSHYAIGFYHRDPDNLPFLMSLLDYRTVVRSYFASMMAQTNPNRVYALSGTTDRYDNTGCKPDVNLGTVRCDDSNPQHSLLNTIWDNLGSSGSYYHQGTDYIDAFWGGRYAGQDKGDDAQFIDDVTNRGILNAVTVLDAYHYHPDSGEDISKVSDPWLASVINPILTSFGSSTIIVITFDEGGGFFDSRTVPKVPTVAPFIDNLAGANGGVPPDNNGNVPQGFRVPAIIVSSYGSRFVDGFQYEHSSVLKMIEWFLGLPPITIEPWSGQAHRDQALDTNVANLACALDFGFMNLLQNAGFELYRMPRIGIPGWTSDHATPAVSEIAHPHGGRQNAICSTNGSDCGISQRIRAPRPGIHTYTVSFYAAASVAPAPKTDGRVGADGSATVSLPVVADGTYHLYTMSVTAAGGSTIRVWMYAGAQSGWVAIDDVKLSTP